MSLKDLWFQLNQKREKFENHLEANLVYMSENEIVGHRFEGAKTLQNRWLRVVADFAIEN